MAEGEKERVDGGVEEGGGRELGDHKNQKVEMLGCATLSAQTKKTSQTQEKLRNSDSRPGSEEHL